MEWKVPPLPSIHFSSSNTLFDYVATFLPSSWKEMEEKQYSIEFWRSVTNCSVTDVIESTRPPDYIQETIVIHMDTTRELAQHATSNPLFYLFHFSIIVVAALLIPALYFRIHGVRCKICGSFYTYGGKIIPWEQSKFLLFDWTIYLPPWDGFSSAL